MKSICKKIKLKFLISKRKWFPVPDMDEKRSIIEFYRQKYDIQTFVETGTFLGHTVDFFKAKFNKIYSIELSHDLAAKAHSTFADYENIEILEGNSIAMLPLIIKKTTGPILFWLDGHYSSEFFLGEDYIITAKGEKNTPIVEELEIILQSNCNAIILIDDACLFNGTNDYPRIKNLKQKVTCFNKNLKLFVKKDIIHIIPLT